MEPRSASHDWDRVGETATMKGRSSMDVPAAWGWTTREVLGFFLWHDASLIRRQNEMTVTFLKSMGNITANIETLSFF